MTAKARKRGLVYLLGCLFGGSVFAAPALNVNDSGNGVLTKAAACAIGEGRWGGGQAIDAERWSDISEDLLLVGAGAELIVFDISTPTVPVELGRALVNHSATSVAVSADGSIAAVSDWFDNVTLVDISVRTAPVAAGSYAWAGIQQPTGMAFDGDYLYVAVRTIGLSILDISDPATPTFVANSDGSPSNFVFDVALHGDYAYLGQNAEGVQIVDISDPNIPSIVGNHAASTGAGQITIEGSRAHVARGANGFDILDLTNPIAPAFEGNFDTLGFAYEAAVLPGDRLAVADNIDGTVIYDISTPATPVVLGDYGFSPYRLVALDDRVFIIPGSEQTSRIQLVDFQTPASPTEISQIDFDARSRAVSVGTNHILVANSERGVVMLDTTNPVSPSEVGRVDIGFDARKVGHVNGYGVASTSYDKDIAVIDLQPSGPTLVTTINNVFQTNDLIDDGTRLYVASGSSGGLRIYDMSNPPTPVFLGSVVPAGETVWQVAVSGSYAYSGYVNDTDHRQIRAQAPLSVAGWIRDGMQVSVEHNDLESLSPISYVIPVGDQRSRMFEIRIKADNPAWIIGSPVRIALPNSEPRELVAIPRDGLVLRGTNIFVMRVNDDNTVEKVMVETGIGLGGLVEVIGKVSQGDLIVTRGGERLQSGQVVKISEG